MVRAVVILLVATFVSSCFCLTKANDNLQIGRKHENSEVHRLHDGGDNHMEDYPLDSSLLDNDLKRFHSKRAPSATVADQVELSRARQEKLDALMKMSEERGFPIGSISLGILIGGIIGWVLHGQFDHKSSSDDASAMGNMSGSA